MNRDDIIRMAREAGSGDGSELSGDAIARFAALVAAAERERIKQANAPEIEKINAHIKALEDAVAVEREACAKVCEEHWRNNGNAMECADAIRARGNE